MSQYTLRSDIPLTDVPGIVNGTINPIVECFMEPDYETLANPSMIGMLYFVLFMILFLENGLLPPPFTRRQPAGAGRRSDSQRCNGFSGNPASADDGSQPGCWLSYIQGRWLGNTRIVQNWLSHLPSTTISAHTTCFISTGSPPC